MNTRDNRIFRSGYFFHVYNRGNNREDTYVDAFDYHAFLLRTKILLGRPVPKGAFGTRAERIRVTPFSPGAFTIVAYCLMPNHFHFLIRQNTEEYGIDQFMLRLLTSYSKYFNIRHERVGNVFQDRFKAKLVDSDEYITYLSAYIHNNPTDASVWQYSSFPDYCLGRGGSICDKSLVLGYFNNSIEQYAAFVQSYGTGKMAAKEYLFDGS